MADDGEELPDDEKAEREDSGEVDGYSYAVMAFAVMEPFSRRGASRERAFEISAVDAQV